MSFFLFSVPVDNKLAKIIDIVKIPTARHVTGAVCIDKFRVRRNGIGFHSKDYPHRGNSSSFYVQFHNLHDNCIQFGVIEKFFKAQNNTVFATITCLVQKDTLLIFNHVQNLKNCYLKI